MLKHIIIHYTLIDLIIHKNNRFNQQSPHSELPVITQK